MNMSKQTNTYNERIYELDTLGQYTIGAFDIYVRGDINGDLSKLSDRDLGTFVHEYVHFLQNITTLYGIYEGIIRNNAIVEMIKSYQEVSEIQIPYQYPYDKYQKDFRDFLKESAGTGYIDVEIDRTRDISLKIEELSGYHKALYHVHCKCYDTDGKLLDIIIGSTIIMEYMAILCQSFVEPDMPYHPDVPYNVLDILSEKIFPNIAHDKKKLIYLCYFSLFDLNPGYSLMHAMKYAHMNPSVSGIDIFTQEMAVAIKYQGKQMPVKEFYNFMLENYKRSINKLLGGIPPYLLHVLDKVKMVDDVPPIITILEAYEIDVNLIQQLIGWLGVPYVHNFDNTLTSKIENDDKKSLAMLIPSMVSSMFSYIKGENNGWGYACPFASTCEMFEGSCDRTPWNKKDCMFDVGMELIKIKGKRIITPLHQE